MDGCVKEDSDAVLSRLDLILPLDSALLMLAFEADLDLPELLSSSGCLFGDERRSPLDSSARRESSISVGKYLMLCELSGEDRQGPF